MGAIEPLLGIVDMKNATGLVLASGEVPSLLPAGARSALTMPPLSVIMLDHLLSDLLTPSQRTALFSVGSLECVYESPAHGPFAIRASTSGDKLKLTLTRGGKRAAAPEPPASSPVAMPSVRRAEPSAPALESVEPDAEPVAPETAALFETALDQAVARHASDVIFSAGATPWMRVDGDLIECVGVPPTPPRAIEAYFQPHLGDERRRTYAVSGSVDFAFEHAARGEATRFRANLFRHGGGAAVALRPITGEIPTLAELHLPTTLAQLVESRHGLVVFTGATGSGKSTTLAALLEHVNRTRAAHIVTLEDPIEYAYARRRSVIHQREVGLHVDSFASGLRAALRENPDVLLVGEMRDAETIRLALTAAQTGHLVLATLHSGGSIGAIDRIIDGFSEGEKVHVRHELATTLRHVVAQQLLPALAGGRLPALEILSVNHAVAALIRDGRTHMISTPLETGADDGMVPMARALATLVRTGRVARAVALGACEDRATLEKLLEDRPAARPR